MIFWKKLTGCTCDDNPYSDACDYCLATRGCLGYHKEPISGAMGSWITREEFELSGYEGPVWVFRKGKVLPAYTEEYGDYWMADRTGVYAAVSITHVQPRQGKPAAPGESK